MNTNSIEYAKKLLEENNLVAIPTETVYGLAANAFSEEAIKKIYTTKGRPSNNPLIVHISSKEKLGDIAINIPAEAHKLAQHFWPGPLTLVLEKNPEILNLVTSGKNTVGIRVPNHPTTLELLNKLSFPIVAPSANKSNHISPTSPQHVRESLSENTPYILDGGECLNGIESTIVGFRNNQPFIYRLGAISIDDIETALGKKVNVYHNEKQSPLSPGMFKKHYSPKIPLILSSDVETSIRANSHLNIGLLTFKAETISGKNITKYSLSKNGDLKEAAKNLYKGLYELESKKVDLIIAEKMPNHGLGLSINDRLTRASHK